jgi:hypothetical protein
LLLNVCDAPKAQEGQNAPLASTFPFGRSQTPHLGVRAILKGVAESLKLNAECCFLGEQSQNVHENKGSQGKTLAAGASR